MAKGIKAAEGPGTSEDASRPALNPDMNERASLRILSRL